ncbi:MAG: ribose-phosphate diphosphokinase [Patescibacteria group bacterium]
MRPIILSKLFPDGESYIRVANVSSLKNKKVTLFKRLYPDPEKNIFELLLTLSAVRKSTRKISVLVPYLPYARQDKENKKGEAVSADVLCRLLKSAGVKRLITYDCHFLPRPGRFVRTGLLIENRSAGPLLRAHAKKFFGKEEFLIISPDHGTAYMSEHAFKKTRKDAHEIHKMESKVDARGKNVCILDDIISTGGTILHAIKHLKRLGAKKIIVGATHGVFAIPSMADKIKRNCGELFVTDSIPQKIKGVKILKLPRAV